MMALVWLVFILALGVGAMCVGYLLLLTVAAWCAPSRTAAHSAAPRHRFAVLIPAHNEAQLLPKLLANLAQVQYPKHLYTIHVIADNCTDATASIACAAGAIVHERHNAAERGKGYALAWMIERLTTANERFDALVIVDADSRVSANFLAVMDARLANGAQVIQAHYAVDQAEQSWGVDLRTIAMSAFNYLRPLGRATLGWSAGLKGNGMVFTAGIAQRYPWPASLAEDADYHTALVLDGITVQFAADATVWAEMPATLRAARSQQQRWEQGRLDVARRCVPALARASWQGRRLAPLDTAAELILPPLAVVAVGTIGLSAAALSLHTTYAIVASGVLVVGLMAHVLSGPLLAGAPWRTYQALLFAPVFVIWKLWMYSWAVLQRGQTRWIRTSRNS